MRIEIICTGDEVLTGKIVNTNFSYISQKLEDVGLSVRWRCDEPPQLRVFGLMMCELML
jgi:molybdopterin-biosynthesis enzyme MoeA-like protein